MQSDREKNPSEQKLNKEEVAQFIIPEKEELLEEYVEDELEDDEQECDIELEAEEEHEYERVIKGIDLQNFDKLLPWDRKPARNKSEMEEIGDMFLNNNEEGTLGSLYILFDRLSQSLSMRDAELLDDESPTTQVMDNKQFQTRMGDLTQLPDINKIQTKDYDEMMARKKILTFMEEEPTDYDKGVFVDPLTGYSISSSTMKLDEEYVSEELSFESDEVSIYREDSELLEFVENRYELEQELFRKPSAEVIEDKDEEDVEQFLEDIKHLEVEDVPAHRLSELLRLEKQREQNQKLISDFLQHLIWRAVQTVEYVDPKVILRKNLDKHKVALKMLDMLYETRLEQRILQILTRKTTDFFRRKKAFRYLQEDPHTILNDRIKYYENLEYMDTLLGNKNHRIENKRMIEDDLHQKYDELYGICMEESENFKELLCRTFLRQNSSDKYQTAIHNLLRRMNRAQMEVDNERRELIYQQSCVANLKSKLEKLEHLGDGLTFSDYNNRMTETIGLTKLLDDKTVQLNELRKHCEDSMHIHTHFYQNNLIERRHIMEQLNRLRDKEDEKQELREELHILKTEHIKLMQEMKNLQDAAGTMGKSAILQDYDRITARIPIVRNKVNKLKDIYEKMTKRLDYLRKNCVKVYK